MIRYPSLPEILMRIVLPQNPALVNAVAKKHQVPAGELRAKTLSKGNEARGRLAQSAWLPKSARLRVRGLAQ